MEKFVLEVQYKNQTKLQREFPTLKEAADFYKENFLYHAIASVIFADDMTEYEKVDFDTFFEDLKDNDEEAFAKFQTEANAWELAKSEDLPTLFESILIYNENFAKELTDQPVLCLS